jgi:hypothetical protein
VGTVAGVLAAAMVVVGYMVSIAGARRGFMGQFPNEPTGFVDALAFLTLGLGDIVLFALFAGAGLWLRAKPEAHKRLMMLATVSLLSAAATRLPIGRARLPFAFTVVTAFLLVGPIYDRARSGRAHPIYVWGGLAIVVSGALRPVVGNTQAWHRVAEWLIG